MDKRSGRIKSAAEVAGRIKERLRSYAEAPGATAEERKEIFRRKGKKLARGAGMAVLGLLFTRAGLPFGAAPFGAALMCAASDTAPYIYVGLCVSSLFSPSPLAVFLTYSFGMLARIAASLYTGEGRERGLFHDGTLTRVLCGIFMAFVIGVYRTVSGGLLYYDLFGCLIGMAAAPAGVLVFRTALDGRARFSALREACLALTAAVGVWSLSGLTLAGFSLSTVAAFLITLYVACECGMLRGGAVGLLCGLGAGPARAPLFALAGLTGGLFRRVSPLAATASALGVGIFYGIWTEGGVSVMSVLPDLLAASVIYLPLARFGLIPGLPVIGGDSADRAACSDAELSRRRRKGGEERFEAMQYAFGSLAEVFCKMSEKIGRPGVNEIHERCRQIFDKYCVNCARHSLCWDKNCTDTSDAVDIAARKIREEGRVLLSDIPDHTLRRCFRAEQIVNDINADHSAMIERMLKENKAEIFARDYKAVSELIGEALRANAEEFKPDEKLTKKLTGSIGYLDLPVSGVTCYGVRRKTIVAGGVDLSRVRAGAEDIRRSFERICGFPLDTPEFAVERTGVSMTVRSARRFRAVPARAGKCREGEELNGDSVAFFDNGQDYFYALLSDGMGSGSEAALTSRICGVFLDKMLRAGNGKKASLDMLNDVVRGKGIECFATVDLFELDLLSGDACFVKSGAAPSYVIRGDSVFRIESDTYPIGIVKEAESEQTSFKLEAGDVVVLLSDGVASCFDEALWVVDLLAADVKNGEALSSICERVVNGARARGRGDDASCAMIRIEAA